MDNPTVRPDGVDNLLDQRRRQRRVLRNLPAASSSFEWGDLHRDQLDPDDGERCLRDLIDDFLNDTPAGVEIMEGVEANVRFRLHRAIDKSAFPCTDTEAAWAVIGLDATRPAARPSGDKLGYVLGLRAMLLLADRLEAQQAAKG